MIEPLERFAQTQPFNLAWQAALAFVQAELGHFDIARARFEPLAQHAFTDLPRDGNWLILIWFLSLTCRPLDNTRAAKALYTMLAPFDDQIIVTLGSTFITGACATALGALATTIGEWDAAAQHFDAALRAGAEAKPFGVLTRREYAHMMLARGRAKDRKRAAETIGEGIEMGREMGLARLVTDLRSLQLRLETPRRRDNPSATNRRQPNGERPLT
jgi:hypothetical protein